MELRIDSPGCVSKELHGEAGGSRGFMEIQVRKLGLELKMSSLLGMLDLIEDETIQLAPPLDVKVFSTQFVLTEDRPPSNPLTSPKPIPLKLNIHNLNVHRDEHLGLHIRQHADVDGPALEGVSETAASVMNGAVNDSETLARNSELERQLATVKRQLEEALRENTDLQRTLKSMQSTLEPSSNANISKSTAS